MAQRTFSRSVSTWSLHRMLGSFVAEHSSPKGGRRMRRLPDEGGISLLELPATLAARGYQAVQICHFHIASTDEAYLDSLRGALDSHGIELDVLLVDAGDITADDAEHQIAWISDWIVIAARLGAKRARVCAGHSRPTPELLDMSGGRLALVTDQDGGTAQNSSSGLKPVDKTTNVEPGAREHLGCPGPLADQCSSIRPLSRLPMLA